MERDDGERRFWWRERYGYREREEEEEEDTGKRENGEIRDGMFPRREREN